MKDITIIKPEKALRQSNRLIEAQYKLTPYEQRMVVAFCSQLSPEYAENDKVRLIYDDVVKFCKIAKHQSVEAILTKLRSRVIKIKSDDGKGYRITGWINSAEYLPTDGVIEYSIDTRLLPELLKLKEAFLTTPAEPLMTFRKNYSTRIYLMLKKWVGHRTHIDYSLDDIRDKFVLGKGYKLFGNLKLLLDRAIAELNEKSDLDIKHDYIKVGRSYKFIALDFKMKEKPVEIPADKQDLYDKLVGERWGVSPSKAAALLKYSRVRLERNIRYAYNNRQGKEANMGGWLVSCIEADHAGVQDAAQADAKTRAEENHQAELEAAADAIRAESAETQVPDPDAGQGHAEKLRKLMEKLGKA